MRTMKDLMENGKMVVDVQPFVAQHAFGATITVTVNSGWDNACIYKRQYRVSTKEDDRVRSEVEIQDALIKRGVIKDDAMVENIMQRIYAACISAAKSVQLSTEQEMVIEEFKQFFR